ncbi:ATP-binding protein [Streptomyces sp. NPDC059894]|uniref:ATP-binding protein n=1 Tax=unclassified Streptomyces TaxID=2593676 RepID=UPI00366A41FD
MTDQQDRIIGRDGERARIAAFTTAGDGRALVLRGEAGVGKSVLLDEVAGQASGAGHRVVRALGVETESGLPFAGLHQLLHPLLPRDTSLDRDHRSVLDVVFGRESGGAPSIMALGIAVLDLLALAASEEPLLLVIDDGHWFDEPSADVCSFVARRLAGYQVKLLVGLRTDTESAFDAAGLPEVLLEPLSEEESCRLLDQRHPGLAENIRRIVLDNADGNPLALMELPRTVTPGVAHMIVEDLGGRQGLPLTRRLERLYARRVHDLPPGERAELVRGALDGIEAGSVPRRVIGARYRMRQVEGARAQGLLTVDPATGDFTFRHPLVRSAVVQLATPNERRAAHSALAELHRSDVERRAVHLAAATVDPDVEVADALERAAHSATRRGGAATAVAWLTRAAELSVSAADRSRRLGDAAFIAGQSGLLDQAERLVDESGRASGGSVSPGSVITSSYVALYKDGDVRSTHRRVLTAIEEARRGGADDETMERLLNLLLAISQFSADPAVWSRTDALIDSVGDAVAPLTLLYRDSWGDVVRRGATVRERLDDAFARMAGGEPWDVMRLAVSAFYVDALGDFRPYLQRMVEREKEAGAVTNVMTMLHLVMLDQISTGAWDEAEANGRRGLDLTTSHGYELFAHQFRAFLGLLAAGRGELERARELQSTIEAWARPRGIGFLTQYAETIGALAALSSGDYEAAYVYASGLTAPGEFTPYSQQAARTLLDLVEAALHTGRTAQARVHAVAARDARLSDVSPRLGLLTTAALAMTGDDAEADELFAQAVAHPAGPSFPFDLARIQLAHGMWLRRARRPKASREAFSRAADLFERLGAASWEERARLELRAAGAPVRKPGGGAAALTPQERQIADLAAGGLSNKEIGAKLFLSPRTVGAHLYKVFPKLGITSRASLRDALAKDGTEEDGPDM